MNLRKSHSVISVFFRFLFYWGNDSPGSQDVRNSIRKRLSSTVYNVGWIGLVRNFQPNFMADLQAVDEILEPTLHLF